MIFEKYYENNNLLLISYKAKLITLLFLNPFENFHDTLTILSWWTQIQKVVGLFYLWVYQPEFSKTSIKSVD